MATDSRTADSRDVSIKVRRRDYEAAQKPTADLPITFLDIFTAMRLMWENAPERTRMQFIRQVRQLEAELQSNAA